MCNASLLIRALLPTTLATNNLTARFLLWCYECNVASQFTDNTTSLTSERQSEQRDVRVIAIHVAVLDAASLTTSSAAPAVLTPERIPFATYASF